MGGLAGEIIVGIMFKVQTRISDAVDVMWFIFYFHLKLSCDLTNFGRDKSCYSARTVGAVLKLV